MFVDLHKAFHTVGHKILLSKFNHYTATSLHVVRGIADQAHFIDRQQFVLSIGASCFSLTVRRGAPQSSVLGPLLFLLIISTLPSNQTYHFAKSLTSKKF